MFINILFPTFGRTSSGLEFVGCYLRNPFTSGDAVGAKNLVYSLLLEIPVHIGFFFRESFANSILSYLLRMKAPTRRIKNPKSSFAVILVVFKLALGPEWLFIITKLQNKRKLRKASRHFWREVETINQQG